jgi:CRP-like cAMP-binding protein
MADETRLTKRQLKKLVKEQSTLVKKDPNNLVARLKLAGALKDLGKSKEAVDHYQAVAKAYGESGKLVQAISVYKGILEIVPGDAEVESALSELSTRHAEEIKAKSMPRLQQVDGRWVMPAESEVSEEEGTDPGKAPSVPPTQSPSKLRLPAPPPEPGGTRRTRRSRPRVAPAGGAAPPGEEGSQHEHPGGMPAEPVEPQAALPSFLERGDAPEPAPLEPEAPESETPEPQPSEPQAAMPQPSEPQAPEPGAPEPQAPRGEEGAELVLTADVPAEEERPEGTEEPTSPGPSGYDEHIRKSMPRLDVSGIAPERPAKTDVPSRRTLVGVPLAEPPEPSRAAPQEVGAPDNTPRTRGAPPPASERAWIPGSPAEPRTGPEVLSSPPPAVPAAASAEFAPPGATTTPSETLDETLGNVFDEEEDAFWAELAGQAPASSGAATQDWETPHATAQRPDGDTGPQRSPRATMPLPAAVSPPPGASVEQQQKRPPDDGDASWEGEGASQKAGDEVRLEEIQLFRDLSESSRGILKSRMITRQEKTGTVIVKEGDPGNALFVVSSGRVDVTKQGKSRTVKLATLGPGAFFGEFALLSDRRRHATVTVAEDGVFFEISRKVIADLTNSDPSFGNTLRIFYRRRLLNTLVQSAPFFHPLTEKERDSLMGRLRFRRIAENTKIITEGEPGGGFFLILIGTVQVTQAGKDGEERILARLGDGTYFGEMSLLKGGNAVASVSTVTPVELVQLAAAEFYRVLSNYPQIWEEVNQEAKRRELANLQILSGRSSSQTLKSSVIM